MTRRVVVIGAGIGGLSSAIRLARHGCRVTIVEARQSAGGLASGFELDGFRFDAGPYVLLDLPGLEWAFRQLEIEPDSHLSMQRIQDVYQVEDGFSQPVSIYDSLEKTAAAFDSQWPGSGEAYRRFIDKTGSIYQRLQPLQWQSHPGLLEIVRSGAWRDIPFVLRSLGSVLKSSRLPEPVVQALGIWTHVAGQLAGAAPSPLALVTSVIHRVVEKEHWWRELFDDVRVLQTRIPCEWGSQFHLHHDSMNPVMTSRFMLTGRVAHRSPWRRNLYLAGSATHPGQWVSFCAVSGILAADRLLADAGIGQ